MRPTVDQKVPVSPTPISQRSPSRSPWGKVDHVRQVGSGILEIHTPSHGGLKLSRARNLAMPEPYRRKGGWYEEDCEWALVALVHREMFSAAQLEHAEKVVRDLWPHEYMQVTGVQLSEADSRKLREEAFLVKTHNHYMVRAAWGSGSGIPRGSVGVVARRESDQDEIWLLLPKQEYDNHGEFGFLVEDPSQYETWMK